MTRFASFAWSARLAAAGSVPGPAVVDGAIRWGWDELDEMADAVATGLAREGVGSGDRVAVLAMPSAAVIAVLHGIARIGAVAVPLGVGLTATEAAAAAAVIDPRIVVYGPGFDGQTAAAGRPSLALDDLIAAGESRQEPGGSPRRVLDRVPGTDLDRVPGPKPGFEPESSAPAVIVLTSGTTGRPRAGILSTAALEASVQAWLAALPPATGWLLAVGLGHVAGLGVVWRAALSGVPLVVLPRADAASIVRALDGDPAPSHVSLVPTMLARVLDAVEDGLPPPTLRAVLLGGGSIPPELVTRALRAGWPIVPTYGLTEAGSGVTALATAEAARHPGSAGLALPGVTIRIAEPADDGVGEILVRSPARFLGYLGDPVATAAALMDGGWLRTGDLGRMDPDGYLTVLDRRTDRIIRGGENISPAEVEAVLLMHPAIADAAVVPRRDVTFGQVPVAAIVLSADAVDPGDDVLTRHCRERLAGFKVPTAFVRLATLPRTPVGKLRRAELRATLDPDPAPAPEPSRVRHLERPGGVRLGYRTFGAGPIHVLLLHGTLSTARQLTGLARLLAASGALTVHAVDRRGSGESRIAEPAPISVDVHVDDLIAVMDGEGSRAAVLVGVSFGGVVALELAARVPDRALAVVVYEPPYGPLADAQTQDALRAVAAATERAWTTGGAASAAETFMRGVADDAWDRLPDRSRASLAGEGVGAYVDVGLRGLDPSGLSRIHVPVTILSGDASEPFYRPIAEVLAERIPGALHVHLPRMTHASPITDPAPIAEAVMASLAATGVIRPDPIRLAATDRHAAARRATEEPNA